MAGKLMRAVQYSSYGGGAAGLKHVEVPIPDAKADELLLKVGATSLNPIDWKMQKGVMPFRIFFPRKFPAIPGTDVAGEVVHVGSKVTKFKAGDKVVAYLGLSTGGGLAEYAVAKESSTVAMPPEVSASEAAGLPIAGVTAHRALTHACGINLDRPTDNENINILVTAGSGGVGHYAVQLAKLANAHVTATCGARNLDFVRALGADEVIDYKTPEGAALMSPSGRKYDYVIHCTTGIAWSTFEPNLGDNARVIDLTPGPATYMWTMVVKRLALSRKRPVPYIVDVKTESMECLVGLVKERKLKTVVDSRYGLSDAGEAWEKILSGHAYGKVVVEP